MYDSYTLNLTDSVLSVTVEVPDLTPTEPVGSPEQVSWEDSGANKYIVEYSTDNFEHVVAVVTTGNAVDSPDLPAGTYQWNVRGLHLGTHLRGNRHPHGFVSATTSRPEK